jgi:hypothetical protein
VGTAGYGTAALALALASGEMLTRRGERGTMPEWWFDPVLDQKHRMASKLARRGYHAEAIAIGHSMVFDWFDPVRFSTIDGGHRRAFNAGANFTVREIARDWVRTILRIWRPSLVVMGFSTVDLNVNGTIQAEMVAKHVASPAGKLKGLGGPPDVTFWRRSAMIRNCSRLVSKSFVKAALRGTENLPVEARLIGPLGTDLHKLGKSYVCNEGFQRAFRERWLIDFEVGERQLLLIEDMLNLVERAGASPLMVWAPYTEDFVNLHPRGAADLSTARDALGSLCADRGLRLLAPPPEVLRQQDFADPIHLGTSGTKRMTDWIATVC